MASTCGVCGDKVGMLQSGWHCPDCGTYMHFDCSIKRPDGYYCPNCNAKIHNK